jgi:TPR repeat protein
MLRRRQRAVLLAALLGIGAASAARADALGHATAAYNRGDYVRAARELSVLAAQGDPKALGLLGFMYEHGFGESQAYVAAADLYAQGAAQGNPFAQAMLGLTYDKGHGVPQDFVLAYKWLDVAAARTRGHEHDTYARFRDAVASKMSRDEIAVGQRLALSWTTSAMGPPGFESASRFSIHK